MTKQNAIAWMGIVEKTVKRVSKNDAFNVTSGNVTSGNVTSGNVTSGMSQGEATSSVDPIIHNKDFLKWKVEK